jgi:hypothetical protein
VDAGAKLAAVEAELAAARRKLAEAEVRRQVERRVAEVGAVDVDAAAVLVERAIAQGSEAIEKVGAREIARAVEELKKRKPALFRAARVAAGVTAIGAKVVGAATSDAARGAIRPRDRKGLLEYLRRRRSGE